MPGAPATRTTDPGTKPPPRTRSTPAAPVENRCSSGSRASVETAGRFDEADLAVSAGCSPTDPQVPQDEHLPDHCEEGRPQLSQTNSRLSFLTPIGPL